MVTIDEPVKGFVFLCGQCPVLPDGTVFQGTVAEKTRLMCENTKNALEAAGTCIEKVIKVIVGISSLPRCFLAANLCGL